MTARGADAKLGDAVGATGEHSGGIGQTAAKFERGGARAVKAMGRLLPDAIARPAQVDDALAEFKPVAYPLYAWIARNFWWVVLVSLPVDFLVFFWGDLSPSLSSVLQLTRLRYALLLSPHLLAAIGAFQAREVLYRVPETLRRLWNRRVISAPAVGDDVDREFCAYVNSFHDILDPTKPGRSSLNGAFAVANGVAFAGLFYLLYPALGIPWTFPKAFLSLGPAGIAFVADFFMELIAAFILGVYAWRIIVIAWSLRQLGSKFRLRIQIGHPDNCGGLRPVGDLCFSIGSIWGVAAIYPTVWIVVLSLRDVLKPLLALYFAVLLMVTVGLAMFTFFFPLYEVHRDMLRVKPKFQARLDEITVRQSELAQQVADPAVSGDPTKVAAIEVELADLAKAYEHNSPIPTWPVETTVVRKFVITQLVPLTGVAAWLPSYLGKVLDKKFGVH